MNQLSIFNTSTDVRDYLSEIKHEGISINKKLSKSINSKGYQIVMNGKSRLCYVQIRNHETFIQLLIRDSDDWCGISIPCSPYHVGKIINAAIERYLKYGDDNNLEFLYKIERW